MRRHIHQFDQTVTQWVASTFGTRTRTFFLGMTTLGDPAAVVLISLSIVLYGASVSDVRVVLSGLMIPATVIVGATLKILFERARPVTEYAMNMKLQTFSFPSGHSSGSMIAYGVPAYMAFTELSMPWSYAAVLVLLLIPVFVGVSRVYLGAHFPSDVIAGWLLGLAALTTVILLVSPLA